MLKGQAKTDYQREYMRKRRGLTGSNKGLTQNNVRPILRAQGLTLEGNIIKGVTKQPVTPTVTPDLPICTEYNYRQFKPGDKVLMRNPYNRKLVETIIPELDIGGQPMYE